VILRSLIQFAERRGLTGEYERRLAYTLVLSAEGSVVAIEDKQAVVVPKTRIRGNAIFAGYFIDNTEYVFGTDTSKNGIKKATAFRELVDAVVVAIDDPGAKAVAAFLHDEGRLTTLYDAIVRDAVPGDLDKMQNFVFRLAGDEIRVHDRPAIRERWSAIQGESDEPTIVCRVTGTAEPRARLHPDIKGIPGSNSAKLIAFQKPVFRFEGRTQGANFEMSLSAANAYGAALNFMLESMDNRRHRMAAEIGRDSVALVYTLDDRDLTPLLTVLEPPFAKKEAWGATIEKAWGDLTAWREDTATCYVLVLKGETARIMILDFFQLRLGDLVQRLEKFRGEMGSSAITFKTALSRLEVAGVETTLGMDIFRSVINDLPYPVALNSTRQPEWRLATLNRSNKEFPVTLDINRPEQAYHLGRLAAAVERLQADCYPTAGNLIPIINTMTRYPAKSFQILTSKMRHYIVALRRSKKKWRGNIQVAEGIFDHINHLPAEHSRADQALFDIGYMHQKNEFGRTLRENQAKREAERAAKVSEIVNEDVQEVDDDDDQEDAAE
jgi:CRISPR-associated protein Csd1